MFNSSRQIQSRPDAEKPSSPQSRGEDASEMAGSKAGGSYLALSRLLGVLRMLREATGNPELQAQTISMFVFIASRHPNAVAQREMQQQLGLEQTTVSRNCQYLAGGSATGLGGYKLIEVEEDPFYRKRKLAKLTAKGEKLALGLASLMGY